MSLTSTRERTDVRSIWENFAGAGVAEMFLDAGGIRTRTIQAGSGYPLILLHGTGGHAETYTRNIVPLSRDFHVVAVDMIGHGFTDRPDVLYTMDVFADHVIAVLDELGAADACLSGESLGGGVACWTALKYPDRVRALSLNTGILARPDAKGILELDDVEQRTRKLAQDFSEETIRRRLEWLVLDPRSITDELVAIRYLIYSQPGMVDHMVQLMCTVLEMNRAKVGEIDYYAQSLSPITCPTLAIWTDHNPGKKLDVVRSAIEEIPNHELHLLSDAAHWPQWEKPDEVNTLMRRFLLDVLVAGS